MRVRFANVFLSTVAFGAIALLLGHEALSPKDANPAVRDVVQLEARVQARLKAFKGLGRCDEWQSQRIDRARSALVRPGAPADRPLVVLAPSFSETLLILLGETEVHRFHLRETASLSPAHEHTATVDVAKVEAVAVELPWLPHVRSAIWRSTHMAVGTVAHGLDGTIYYFSPSPGYCVVTWSPSEFGVASELAAIAHALASKEVLGAELEAPLARLSQIEAGL